MGKEYREFSFEEDVELMNLTYQMNTGNFTNNEEENILNTEEMKIEPKIEL